MTHPVRGTQRLVDQIGWVIGRPSLTALEIAWRWLFGLPLLLILLEQARRILDQLPPQASGLASVQSSNPWVAAVELAAIWTRYQPYVAHLLARLAAPAALAWVILSGAGRAVVLRRLEGGLRLRPLSMMALQAAWLALFALVLGGWFGSMRWAAATHIPAAGEPDLIGLSAWAIFLSLGFFTLWAVISWPVTLAPLLMLLEDRSALSALGRSLRPGPGLTGRLVEINLVMGIVKLALIVLAMVLSAAPLPFSDELGPGAMRLVWLGAVLFYLVASDLFHVVRLKSFLELWRSLRGGASRPPR